MKLPNINWNLIGGLITSAVFGLLAFVCLTNFSEAESMTNKIAFLILGILFSLIFLTIIIVSLFYEKLSNFDWDWLINLQVHFEKIITIISISGIIILLIGLFLKAHSENDSESIVIVIIMALGICSYLLLVNFKNRISIYLNSKGWNKLNRLLDIIIQSDNEPEDDDYEEDDDIKSNKQK